MVNTKNSKRHNVTSKQYEIAKRDFDKINRGRIVSEETKIKLKKPKSDEHKIKLSKYTGPNHFGYGKKRPDHSDFMVNMTDHPMMRPDVLERVSGDNHWSNNPIHRKICEYCNKEVSKSNYKMYHENNCKVKNNG